METTVDTAASALWQESPELVCVATSSSAHEISMWRSALERAGVPTQVQTISVRQHGADARSAYLLYVRPGDEERAMRLIQLQPDRPIFPLAHLRHAAW